jgi:hypothetical protein
MKQRVRLADQPTLRTWLSLSTLDDRRLYPGYLIWGRSGSVGIGSCALFLAAATEG